MEKYLKESLNIIKSNLIYIFIPALLGIQIYSKEMLPLTTVGVLMSVILMPAIYGHFTEIITGETHISLAQTFKKHWFNFYIVGLILSIPVFIIIFFFGRILPWKIKLVIEFVITAAVNVFTIYVFPSVFLRNENLNAISSGIKYLVKNFRPSLPLALLALSVLLMKTLSEILLISFPLGNIIFVLIFGYIQNFLSLFINFTIFITAGKALKENLLKI